MKTLRDLFVCALLAAMTALAVYAIHLVQVATAAAAALPEEIRATRAEVLGEVETARKDLLIRAERQAVALRKDMVREAEDVRVTADRRVGDTLARADVALGSVESLRSDIKPLLDSADETLRDADRTVADLHPQILGLVAASKVTAGETAQTMRSIRDSVPNFIAQGNTIVGNVNTATVEFSGVAANLNRLTKPKWYDRLLGYGLNGLIIYRNLNPATNLTVTGTRLLTSH